MNNSEQNIILSHYKRYPNMQIQDLFKFLYQSSFGCEHLVSSIEEVTDYIQKEYVSITQGMESEVEPLDGKLLIQSGGGVGCFQRSQSILFDEF